MTDLRSPLPAQELPNISPEATFEEVSDWVHFALTNCRQLKAEFSFCGEFTQAAAAAVEVEMQVCALFLKKNFPWMDFTDLGCVVFHHDYLQGLEAAADAGKMPPRPTTEGGAIGLGMMVIRPEAKNVAIVLRAEVGYALISPDVKRQSWALAVIRHELCHVHDFGYKTRLPEGTPPSGKYGLLERMFQPMVNALWDEYFANKYSLMQEADASGFFTELAEALPRIRLEVSQAILLYRCTGNLQKLQETVEPKVKYVIQLFGYALGHLSASGKSVEELCPSLPGHLEVGGLGACWLMCYEKLEQLDESRPGWIALSELFHLLDPCLRVMAVFGLSYRRDGEDAYITVPFNR